MESWTSGLTWGNLFSLEPSIYASPNYVSFAMRCQYPNEISPGCLCPDSKTETGQGTCSKTRTIRDKDYTWGKYDYSDPQYCRKMAMAINKRWGAHCMKHAQCSQGLHCKQNVCMPCPDEACPDKTPNIELSSWPTCKNDEKYTCSSSCGVSGTQCNENYLGANCCEGLRCENNKCNPEQRPTSGPCESHDDSPQGYFCFDGQITDAVGRECHATHDTASDSCSVAGLFCDIGTNTFYRSYDEPRAIYDPIHHSCIAHFDCDEGFHCLCEGTDSQYGTCEVCQIGTHCPDKGSPNVPTCKRAEYNCPDFCILIDKECSTTDLEKGKCCLGLKCGEEGVCVRDECKKSGTCVDDSEGCVNYGCWNSVVVGIVEQRCSSENGLASPNCVGGTFCNTDTDICLCPTGKKRK